MVCPSLRYVQESKSARRNQRRHFLVGWHFPNRLSWTPDGHPDGFGAKAERVMSAHPLSAILHDPVLRRLGRAGKIRVASRWWKTKPCALCARFAKATGPPPLRKRRFAISARSKPRPFSDA
jgi:hypothetical protein